MIHRIIQYCFAYILCCNIYRHMWLVWHHCQGHHRSTGRHNKTSQTDKICWGSGRQRLPSHQGISL